MTQEALKLALEALEKLWSIIDDIDTYSDMAKADEKLYRSLVERRQRKRFEETGITTDGYELSGGAITAIKEALAQSEQETPKGWKSEIWKSVKQQEQEPVTWGVDWGKAGDIPCASIIKRLPDGGSQIMAVEYAPYSYTTPPKQEPVRIMGFDCVCGRRMVVSAEQGVVPAPQRTWVGLTDEDEIDWEEGSSLKDLVKAIESKLREKNESREWQDLTDDEMLMIYGQKHEGKKYNLGRMVQQALKEKNNV